MKRGYGNLVTLAVITDVILRLSYGEVFALPQDWPCFEIEVNKVEVIRDSEDDFEYVYHGERENYTVDINLMGEHQIPNSFANCGTAGCGGIITDKTTRKSEELNFFCEEYTADYTKVTCGIGKGDEFIFDKISDKEYEVHYCSDDKTKTLKFNQTDCQECHCVMNWYDNGNIDTGGQLTMGCSFENQQAHCFTYSGYEKWRNFVTSTNDFTNCLGLMSK